MSLKAKTLLDTNTFLDINAEGDRITFALYRVLLKADFAFRDEGLVSQEVFTGKDEPLALKPLPDVVHQGSLHPIDTSQVFVDGAQIGHPEYFLQGAGKVTFSFIENDYMKLTQAGAFSNWLIATEFGQLKVPYDWFAKSYVTKDDIARCTDEVIAQVAPCYFGAPIKDCAVRIQVSKQFGYRSNIEFPDVVVANTKYYDPFLMQAFPDIKVQPATVIEPNDYATVEVLVTDRGTGANWTKPLPIYLENTGGYLPLQRVDVIDGKAEFRIGALGLRDGESFKVKVGTRYYTGITETICEVREVGQA